MSETYTVKAEARETVGKGAARHLRRNGMVPAVIYGDRQEPLPIAIPYKETFLRLHAGGYKTTVTNIEVNGKTIRVLPKDYQLDPVKDLLIHVDFLRVSSRTLVTVAIPVHFVNEDAAPGLKSGGGTLNVVHHTVEVHCPAESIPEAFTIDLSGLEIGAAIHASVLPLPAGVTLIDTSDFAVATIVPPMGEEPADEPVAADASPAANEAEGGDAA